MPAGLGRLRKRPEFLRVAGARHKCVKPGLILQMLRRTAAVKPRAEVRVGLTASRKIGSAVERNRARRRLRAVAREIMPDHAAPGCDYVIIARKETLARPYPALVRDLTTALKRLGAFRQHAEAVERKTGPDMAREA